MPRITPRPDPEAVRELTLYATNDSQTYHRSTLPTVENLRRKMKRGTYDPARAPRAWEYVAEFAARRYAQEFARPAEWCIIFTAATRRAVALELAEYYTDHLPEMEG